MAAVAPKGPLEGGEKQYYVKVKQENLSKGQGHKFTATKMGKVSSWSNLMQSRRVAKDPDILYIYVESTKKADEIFNKINAGSWDPFSEVKSGVAPARRHTAKHLNANGAIAASGDTRPAPTAAAPAAAASAAAAATPKASPIPAAAAPAAAAAASAAAAPKAALDVEAATASAAVTTVSFGTPGIPMEIRTEAQLFYAFKNLEEPDKTDACKELRRRLVKDFIGEENSTSLRFFINSSDINDFIYASKEAVDANRKSAQIDHPEQYNKIDEEVDYHEAMDLKKRENDVIKRENDVVNENINLHPWSQLNSYAKRSPKWKLYREILDFELPKPPDSNS